LISCQPTALKAVRLQSLVPPSPEKLYIRDLLVKNEVNTPKISRTIQAMILNSKKAVAVKVIAFKHICVFDSLELLLFPVSWNIQTRHWASLFSGCS